MYLNGCGGGGEKNKEIDWIWLDYVGYWEGVYLISLIVLVNMVMYWV